MRRRKHLSLLVAFFLALSTVAPMVVESRSSLGGVVVEASEEGGGAKKGDGFVRALGAPFRALARLFGGKKKSSDEAKKKELKAQEAAARVQAAAAAAAPAPAVTTTAVSAPAVSTKKERSKKQQRAATTVAKSAPAPASEPAPAVEPSPKIEPAPAAGARIVRPAEGQPVPARPAPPKWVPVIEGIGRDPLTQGRALLRHGYPNEAISELSIAAVTGTNLAEANNLLGLAYDRLSMHKQAIDAYERALSASPDDAQVLNNLGYSLFLEGRHAEALSRLKRADRLAPGSPYVLQNIAFVQARLGKYGDAFKTLARAFGDYDARLKTAELLEQAGRADDALKHYEAALKLRPDSPALLERLVAIYERRGRTRDAEAARRALGQPPNKQKTATGGGG